MNIEKGDVLTLSDGKEYLVISNTIVNYINYFYLACLSESDNTIYCKIEENSNLSIIDDLEEINSVLPHLYKAVFFSEKEDVEEEVI